MKKEKDKMSKQRLEEVRKELASINEKLAPLLAEYTRYHECGMIAIVAPFSLFE